MHAIAESREVESHGVDHTVGVAAYDRSSVRRPGGVCACADAWHNEMTRKVPTSIRGSVLTHVFPRTNNSYVLAAMNPSGIDKGESGQVWYTEADTARNSRREPSTRCTSRSYSLPNPPRLQRRTVVMRGLSQP
jgi:hypothetical protein